MEDGLSLKVLTPGLAALPAGLATCGTSGNLIFLPEAEKRSAGMRSDEVKAYLMQATARVTHEDRHLLMVDVSERCIAARLAMYLREYFTDYDVDVEYNRHGDDTKKLHALVDSFRCPRDRDEGRTVLPDVIVHRRGDDKSNLLIIEMKKSGNQSGLEWDVRRIQAFRAELGYKLGALVVCEMGAVPSIDVEWY